MGTLLDVVAGIHASAGGELHVDGLESRGRAKVRGKGLEDIVDRALETVERIEAGGR